MSGAGRHPERGDAPGPDPGWGCTLHAMHRLLLCPRRCRPHPASSGKRGGTGLCPAAPEGREPWGARPRASPGLGVNGVGSSRIPPPSPFHPCRPFELPTPSYEPTPGCLEIPRQHVGEMAGDPPAPSLACTELLLHILLGLKGGSSLLTPPLPSARTRGCQRSRGSLEPVVGRRRWGNPLRGSGQEGFPCARPHWPEIPLPGFSVECGSNSWLVEHLPPWLEGLSQG